MTSSPSPPTTALAYSVPSLYTNLISFTYINGVFRVTFFEQHLEQAPNGTPGEVAQVVAPRVSVVMVPAVAADFLKSFGDLYNQVAKGVITAAAAMMPDESGGRPN